MQTLNACKKKIVTNDYRYFFIVIRNTYEYYCIKFSVLYIQRLKLYEAKTHKKREISNIFKVLYLAQNWLNVFEIFNEYTCDDF
jgi:hypothetical protein